MVAVRVEHGEEDGGAGTGAFEREMDCLDCHNRPAHAFETAERAVDREMAAGALPQRVPRFRRAALAVLGKAYPSREAAAEQIPAALLAYYKQNAPDAMVLHRTELERAGQRLLALYQQNVYPEMKLTWGSYPRHDGHTDSPGCFRCHNEELKTKSGRTMMQDCESCHKVLGVEEKNLASLQELGG
jgi:hypothetical protein